MLKREDILFDVFSGGNPKLERIVRVTHLPTGMVVECSEHRSQFRNREECLKRLTKMVEEYEGN